MARASLEFHIESYFIELFKTHSMLKGKQYRHSDSQEEAEPNVITVHAERGEDLLEGSRGPSGECRSKVEVTVRYRATGATDSKENDAVADAMNECIRTARTRQTHTQNLHGFYMLIITEEISSNRDHTKSTHSREITVPCEAGMID